MPDEENKKDVENNLPETAPDDSEVLEFEFNEDGEEDLKKTLKKFRADLKQAKKEKEEYLIGWQKERAEFANYRKGEDDRKAMFSESMRERILTKFLSVIDSFNMAFANKEAWEKVDENWRQGVEYIHSQLINVLANHGVSIISPLGEMFEPQRDEAVENVKVEDEEEDGKIVEVVSNGYSLQDKIIRAPKVKVAEYKP